MPFFSSDADKVRIWHGMASRIRFQIKEHPNYLVAMGGFWRGFKAQTMVWRSRTMAGSQEFANNYVEWTQVAMFWPQNPQLGLGITRDCFVSRLVGKVAGAQDIEIGDPQFDRAVVVKGHNPAAVRAFLHPALRAEMLHAMQSADIVEFNDYGGSVDFRSWVTDEQQIVAWLETLVRPIAAQAQAQQWR